MISTTPSAGLGTGTKPGPVLKRNISRTRTTSTSEKDSNVHIRGSKTIYTAGRPPWYDSSGQMKEALVIGNILAVEIFIIIRLLDFYCAYLKGLCVGSA